MILAIIKSVLGKTNAATALEERSDEELMSLYAQGDARAFEVLYLRHERPVFGFILRSCKRHDLAEELLQEVWSRVIKSAADYEHKAKFTTWLYTVARNICIDRARRDRRRHELSLDAHVGGEDEQGSQTFTERLVDDHAQVSHMTHERRVFAERLERALAELPEEQREVFMLKEINGLKFREIADIMDVPVPTVKSRMRYALEALRGHLSDYREHSFDEEERQEVTT
jgi:RNA polymerase sigma-70 factor (ECF subfamily)